MGNGKMITTFEVGLLLFHKFEDCAVASYCTSVKTKLEEGKDAVLLHLLFYVFDSFCCCNAMAAFLTREDLRKIT